MRIKYERLGHTSYALSKEIPIQECESVLRQNIFLNIFFAIIIVYACIRECESVLRLNAANRTKNWL